MEAKYFKELMDRPNLDPLRTRGVAQGGSTYRRVELTLDGLKVRGKTFGNCYGEGGYEFDYTYPLSDQQRRIAEIKLA